MNLVSRLVLGEEVHHDVDEEDALDDRVQPVEPIELALGVRVRLIGFFVLSFDVASECPLVSIEHRRRN